MAKKSLIQKAIDGVDHMIHPDHTSEDLDLQNDQSDADQNPTSENNAQHIHPKFDKFKTSTGEKLNDE